MFSLPLVLYHQMHIQTSVLFIKNSSVIVHIAIIFGIGLHTFYAKKPGHRPCSLDTHYAKKPDTGLAALIHFTRKNRASF